MSKYFPLFILLIAFFGCSLENEYALLTKEESSVSFEQIFNNEIVNISLFNTTADKNESALLQKGVKEYFTQNNSSIDFPER